MSLRIRLEARNGITIKVVLDPWLYSADSLEQRESLHQIILLCVPLNHHSSSPSLTFLGSGPLFSSSSRAACAAACLARLRLQPLPSGNSSPQLDPSCEANREKDGERVPADPPGLMKMHLLSRDERLVNQVHFTTDYILYNGVCDELNLQSFQSQKIKKSGES